MNPENTQKLIDAYPLLYRELRNQDFECGDGWFNLVWQLSTEIEAAAQLEGISRTAKDWPSVVILKQKFGVLRVQFQSTISESIEAIVAKAHERSIKICELCGAPALPPDSAHRSVGGVAVLCENCHKVHRPRPRPQDTKVQSVWMKERNGKLK